MTHQPRQPKLWQGEFRLPGDYYEAQRHFLIAVARHNPEVLKALKTQVLPEFVRTPKEKLHERGSTLEKKLWDWAFHYNLVKSSAIPFPIKMGISELYKTNAWVVQMLFHIRSTQQEKKDEEIKEHADWTFGLWGLWRAAWKTLVSWEAMPAKKRKLVWSLPSLPTSLREGNSLEALVKLDERGEASRSSDMVINDTDVLPLTITISHTTHFWDILRETRHEAKARILHEVEQVLLSAFDEQERRAVRVGFVRPPRKAELVHFDWLALYQVSKLSYGQIAKSEYRSPQAIAMGVQTAAALTIGSDWEDWLRSPNQAGRPAKNK